MTKRQPLLFYTLRLLSKIPLPVLQLGGVLIACIFYYFIKIKPVKNAQLNLKIALPELSEIQFSAISKLSTINEVRSYCEFLSIWGSSTAQNIARIHQVHGEQHLHHALDKNKGVVLIIPHFGTWEIMNAWVSQFTTLTIMYKPSKNETANQFVKAARSREKAHLVPTNEVGIKEIFKALKRGGTTAILPDHSPDSSTESTTPWFNVPLYSSHLSAKLIQKTKAAALLLYAVRNQNGGFEMYIQPIDEQIYTAENGTAIIHQALEVLIKAHPEHYHWSYKRFQASAMTRGLYDKPPETALSLIREIQKDTSSRI